MPALTAIAAVSLCQLGLLAGTFAPSAAATGINPSIRAVARTDENSRIAHEQLVEKAKRGGIDVYFVGDSITRRWGATDPQYRPLLQNWTTNFFGWNAADFGWGADKIENILWRLEHGELDGVNPKIIVLLAGINDIGRNPGPSGKAAQIAAGIGAIIDVCRKKAPNAAIILTAIFPRNDNLDVIPIINEANRNLMNLADGRVVRFVDINRKIADENGKFFEGMVTADQLHPTVNTYQVWADALKPIFTEILGPPALSDHAPPPTGDPSLTKTRKITFDNPQALADWTISGGVSVDTTKAHRTMGGALKVSPGGKALLKLRDVDASGQVEFWVYDDGAVPENPKINRAGPRWGLVQNDGRVVAVGILYANYLGGTEGYTAAACNGTDWFDQLFWLGVNRSPAGWHQWIFTFDTINGIQIRHANQNGKPTPLPQFDSTKAGLRGFSAIAVWGDSDKGKGQTLWVDDLAVTLGGPVKSVPKPRPTAPRVQGPNPWAASSQTVPIYTRSHPPMTLQLEDLPLKKSVTQYGITWTFDKPARVGQFINGDWYVVGPATVQSITPGPLYGAEIPEIELDHMDLERPVNQRVRNGCMLNPPALMKVAYDSGVRNFFDPSLIQKLPVRMKAGDSLVSTISMPKGLVLKPQLWESVERGVEDSSPIRTAAVLTCVAEPLPPDEFRPAFCDRQARHYRSRDLKRELLPSAAAKNVPDVGLYIRFTERPWVGTCFFGFEGPVENMPQYGRDYARVVGLDALLLCTDIEPQRKEALLVDFVQVGIDLGGMIRSGHPGWEGFGGHGSGRKLPIVLAGLLLGDDQLAYINRSFPKAHFGEDEQTAYGDAWTGAKVVFTGHRAIDQATGVARQGTGPYEHTPPATWKEGREKLSESYRRCCTSAAWVAEALALHLMKAERTWDHDAFFDYCDRWMYEDETQILKRLKHEAALDEPAWAHEGKTWEPFVDALWAAHRTDPGMPPIDGWKKPHDDSYLRTALEKAQRKLE